MYSYQFTSQEKLVLFQLKNNLRYWIWKKPENAWRYFKERVSYVLEGIDHMAVDEIVIGNDQVSKLFFMESALFCHAAGSKEEYLDHILGTAEKEILKMPEEVVGEILYKNDKNWNKFLGAFYESLISPEETVCKMQELVEKAYDFGKKKKEDIYQCLKNEVWKKIIQEIRSTMQKPYVMKQNVYEEPTLENAKTVLADVIFAEMHAACDVTDDDESQKFRFSAGYSISAGASPVCPEFHMSLNRERFLLTMENTPKDKREEEERFVKDVIEAFVWRQVLCALYEKHMETRCYREEDLPEPWFHPNPELLAQELEGKSDDVKKGDNPFTAKRLIREKPDGYYIRGAYEAVTLALLKRSVAPCWKQYMKMEIAGQLSSGYVTDIHMVNQLRNEKKCAEEKLEKYESKLKKQEKLLKDLNHVIRKKDDKIQQLKQTSGIEETFDSLNEAPAKAQISALQDEVALLQDTIEDLSNDRSTLGKKLSDALAKISQLEEQLKKEQDRSEKKGVLLAGEEKDLFRGETQLFLNDILSDSLKNCREGTRRYDVVKSLLDANPVDMTLKSRQEDVKQILKGTTNMSERLAIQLKGVGLKKESDDGKHAKFSYHGDPRYMITFAKTSSDKRAGLNNANTIIEGMM